MTDRTLADLIEDASPDSEDLIYVVSNPSGTPADRKVKLSNAVQAGMPAYATQAEAEAGTATDRLMTPARTREAVYAVSPEIDITDPVYGADRTGSTDATSAINAAIAAVVATQKNEMAQAALRIPRGEYSVSSLDFTDLTTRGFHIRAEGAVLVPNTDDKAVVDCTGSRYLQFHGLTIKGDSGVVPRCGIQLGPKGTETCGNNAFFACEVDGYFDVAALLNTGSETTAFYGGRYFNRKIDATAYAAVQDGTSYFVPQSDYVTVTRTTEAVSYTNNAMYSTQIRNHGGGDAMFLGGADTHSYDGGCYFLSFNGAAVRLYATAQRRNANIRIDGLFETDFDDQPEVGNTGIKYAIVLDGDGTAQAIDGLRCRTLMPHVETAFLRNESGASYRLSNAHFYVRELLNTGAVFFSDASSVSIDGTIETRDAAKLNLDGLAAFSGTLRVDDFSAIAGVAAAGAYDIFDSTNSRLMRSGEAWNIVSSLSSGAIITDSPYVSASISGGGTVTDIVENSGIAGVREVTIRNTIGTALTFQHNTAKLRNISGTDVSLGQNESITYAFVTGTVWQQVAGKV